MKRWKWEYEVNIMPDDQCKAQELLNIVGSEGWELVAFDFCMGTAILKRIASYEAYEDGESGT